MERTATDIAEVRSLDEVLPGFEVMIARTAGDKLTAYSVSEPWFCFERDTEQEIQDVIRKVIRSYLVVFRQLKHVEIKVETQPLVQEVPVERLKPTSRVVLTTLFGDDPLGHRQMMPA